MPSLREIRRKIKSVKSTEQITRAMKMVAAARMRKAQSAILAARPFAEGMESLARALAGSGNGAASPEAHPFFRRPSGGVPLLILITADKGLCGSFNSNLIKATLEWMRGKSGKVRVAVAGKKGRDFLHRLRGRDFEVGAELAGIFPKVNFSHAEILGESVIADFEGGRVSEVAVLCNEFKSVAQQKLRLTTLLPIEPAAIAAGGAREPERIFEPARERILDVLLRRCVKAEIYRALLESQAAELAARMNAMDAAAKNASELKADLNLDLNRQRQSLITKEIAELVGGAEALAA